MHPYATRRKNAQSHSRVAEQFPRISRGVLDSPISIKGAETCSEFTAPQCEVCSGTSKRPRYRQVSKLATRTKPQAPWTLNRDILRLYEPDKFA